MQHFLTCSAACPMQALLVAGASVDSEDFDGWRPLHVACYYGQAQIADLLLKGGAQVSDAVVIKTKQQMQ